MGLAGACGQPDGLPGHGHRDRGLGLSVYLFLRLGDPLVVQLGPSPVGAISRIFGFLILAIAVQLIWDGVADFKA